MPRQSSAPGVRALVQERVEFALHVEDADLAAFEREKLPLALGDLADSCNDVPAHGYCSP